MGSGKSWFTKISHSEVSLVSVFVYLLFIYYIEMAGVTVHLFSHVMFNKVIYIALVASGR